jgi:hypothetical protein
MDQLSNLLKVERINDALAVALKSVDELNWNRAVRNNKDLIPLARRISGYASASLEGASMPADPRQDPDDSPMGKLSNSALGLTAEVDFHLTTFTKTPLQTWARLHSFIDATENRGRPRTNNEVVDPLHIGSPLPHQLIEDRLNGLVEIVTSSTAPALLVAAIAHAEIATIAPFNVGSQLISRATSRLVLQSKNVDQLKLVMPEYGFYKIGRNSYAKGLIAYQSGTVDGVAEWVELHSQAVVIGASSVGLVTELYAQAN